MMKYVNYRVGKIEKNNKNIFQLYCSIKSMSYEKLGKNYLKIEAKNLEISKKSSIFAEDFG